MCNNETQHWIESANDVFTVFCGVTSVLLNTLVLFIALRYVDFHVKLSQTYVVNMTVSDLLYGMVYMSTKPLIACFPDWLCACYYILVWSSQIGSVFFLLFLNIDKFISLSAPLHYHMYVTEKRVRLVWIVFWTIPFSYSAFTYFGPWIVFSDSKIPCKIGLHPIYYVSAIITFYITPLTLSASISVYVYLLARKKTRWSDQSTECQCGERKKARKQMLKRVFFVFSSTLWSTITILPYRLAYCIYTFACVATTSSSYSTMVSANADNHSLISTSSFPGDQQETMKYNRTVNDSNSLITRTNGHQSDVSTMCNSEVINILIYVLFCLPPLGAVGNPIITIVTQRFYRCRAAQIFNLCVKAVNAPSWLEFKRCGRDTENTDGATISMTNETKLLDDQQCQRSYSTTNTVPMIVMCRHRTAGIDTRTLVGKGGAKK